MPSAGHHAFADLAGGFCFLNNSAITAQHLRLNFQNVAIIDVDVHHGNGTQSIFYQREDVLTVSLHTDLSVSILFSGDIRTKLDQRKALVIILIIPWFMELKMKNTYKL